MNDDHALSFGDVVDAYDRARPSYPADAVRWLVGDGPRRVVELGAGTGKLTALLVAAGHDVLAVEPDPAMAARLRERVPEAAVAIGRAEQIPVGSRSVDVVVCAQSFHWFDHPVALPEIARALRPGGALAAVWNYRDDSIPWVRRLGQSWGRPSPEAADADPVAPLAESPDFGWVDEHQFRFWQDLTRESLLDLALSRSYVAVLDEVGRREVLARVSALYDDYGRGPDGMRLPYVTRCYRAEAIHRAPPPPVPVVPAADGTSDRPADAPSEPPEDTGTLLIDFR